MVQPREKSNSAHYNQSAEKVLTLLETMSTLPEPIQLKDLAEKLDMNASTVLRFLSALQRRGYVAQEQERSRYHLTFKLCALAGNISSQLNIRDVARPFMRNIAHIFKESANLVVEEDMSALYVETVQGSAKNIMAMQRIGHIAPLHCTGVGKIFLLEYTPQRLEQYIAVKGLPRYTRHTITEREQLMRELEAIRANGYSLDNEECEEGSRCVAAPIRDYTGKIVAGLSVSGPVARMTDAHIYTNLPYLLEAAEQISFRLNWNDGGKSR